jgi:T5SS/PEP-CTERM-associated repeat protein
MDVGHAGNGHLTVENGASLTGDYLNIGDLAGSTGTVLVTGAGTTVNTTAGQYQNIGVGFDGTASLTIADHAAVTTTYMDVAVYHDVGVTDTLDVNNASLTSQFLTIGDAGTAIATVENGGTVTAGFLNIGNQTSGTGSLTVDGAGSVVSTGGMNLGISNGTASLTVSNGGAVDIGTGTTTIADAVHVGSSGSLQGTGIIHGNLVDDGNVTATGATLDVTGAVSGSGGFTVNGGAHLDFGGSVAASDSVVFQSSTGSLVLEQSTGFAGLISGFTGDGTLAGSDQIDLKDINYSSLTETFDAGQDTLTLQDGTNTTVLHFVGTYVNQNFSFASDGGTGTIVYDPPVSNPPSVTTGPHTGGSGAVSDSGGGFNFVTYSPANLADLHPEDLLQAGSQSSIKWADALGSSPHDAPTGVNALLEGHGLIVPTGAAYAELNLTHFHIV